MTNADRLQLHTSVTVKPALRKWMALS